MPLHLPRVVSKKQGKDKKKIHSGEEIEEERAEESEGTNFKTGLRVIFSGHKNQDH